MPIRIPFYKQVIIMSFECEHCGYRNNELQSGEPVQEHGTSITLCVRDAAVCIYFDIFIKYQF